MNQMRHTQMNGICMPGCPACDAGEKLGRQSVTEKTWVIWNKKDERSMYLREADGWEVHEVAKAPVYRPNSPEDIKQSMDFLQRIAAESDCEDQGYSSIADGCTKLECARAPIKPDGEWLKCTKCGASYGPAAEPEERYDCPIHGTGVGADCPRCS